MTTVLYIDGDQSCRLMLSEFLDSQGFRVETARDGLEGIKKARALQPGLILLDLQLPRMDGFEVIAQLKGSVLTWNIPVIFMSVLPADCCYRLAQESGAKGYLPKPFQTETLMEVIRKTLPE